MRRTAGPLSTLLCLLALLAPDGRGQAPASANADERLLRDAGVGTDGKGLLEFFRKRAPTPEGRKRAEELVEKLGSGTFRAREKASEELVRIGLPARPALLRAATHKDAEVRRRVQECLAVIERAASPEVESAALRLLKARRPEGAAVVLLDFLPGVRDTAVEEEALAALLAVAVRDGKPDDVLARALDDRDAVRRGAAALVLGFAGPEALRAKVRRLMQEDADPGVRVRAAQGVLAGRDKRAVPALLALLAGPPEVARQAHDLLLEVAGEKAPPEEPGEDAAAWKKRRAGWEAWWKANAEKVDLAKAEVSPLGVGGEQRARRVTMDFLHSMMKGDAALLGRSTEVPFGIMGMMVLNTRQEFDQLFGEALKQMPQQPKFEFSPPRVGDLDQYLRESPAMKGFLDKFPRSEVRVVYVTGKEAGKEQAETAAILVRMRGGRAHVIGLGDVKSRNAPAPPAVKKDKVRPRDR